MSNKTAVIGFLGTTLDNGFNDKRWQRWRPTVSLGLHDELLVDELHILYSKHDKRLFKIIKDDMAQVSPQTQVIGHHVALTSPWDFADVYAELYDFAAGFDFKDSTDYLLHLTTGTHVAQICWFLLVEAGFIPADLIQTSPCPRPDQADPQGRYQVIDLDVSRYDGLRERFEAEKQQHWQTLQANLVTQNATYQKLISDIEKVATRSTAPILLMGATGAGKSQLAGQIYALKKDKASSTQGKNTLEQFVEVNCATLRGDTAMSVLFGHVKGAFTGAATSRDGLLKSADGGLLFLDEIGELGLDEQAMLLTALEEQRFYPLGSDTPISVSFQLMAGTNKDLRQAVANGEFRADLFARLNTWTFFLPSLKDRLEDLPANIDYELARLGSEQQQQYRFTPEARQLYESFAMSADATWQGNFRDLTASMIRLTTLAESKVIRNDDVQAEIERLAHLWELPDSLNGSNSLNGGNVRIKNSLSKNSPDTSLNSDTIEQGSHHILRQYLDEDMLTTIDPFDAVQLAYVIEVCINHKNQAAAGRYLYANSRDKLKSPNDSDRLRKYLLKFGLKFDELK
ncbi:MULTISPECIES: RNA repair transcriptional activator RtcR [unclassified Psychrobacter]|uniref:RNA repair transcriptional activator RtcR n=1 Tax=unclassified Psychrobacter TaxID=196806 RepID=UPI000EC784F5|nr:MULTISPECIES: RNA repair transcriptional activator RtcR [unclassified Psychrobacter]MBE8609967.1 sigma 54-interacting transcriptional regulator [Pseudomonas lundensis]HCI76486.1 transcriptional regulator [Psychrobacter sp.]